MIVDYKYSYENNNYFEMILEKTWMFYTSTITSNFLISRSEYIV